jgi:hypothetical protein
MSRTSVTGTSAGQDAGDAARFDDRAHVAPRMMSTGLARAALRAGSHPATAAAPIATAQAIA